MSTGEIVLVHAGICDNRMWGPIAPRLETTFAVRRHELPGFGDSPMPRDPFSYSADLEASLEAPVVLVGASFGGQVALELAARRPELVSTLVLIDAALPDHEWSAELLDYFAEEERLLDAGEIEAAVELNVSFWVGNAEHRVRELVRAMVRRTFELQSGPVGEGTGSERIELGAVRAPTLVLVGEHDRPDFHQIGGRLVAELPIARSARIARAGHLPALEQPEATAAAILEFIGSPPVGGA